MPFLSRRSFLSASARTAAALTAGSFFVIESAESQTANSALTPTDQALDQFIESYMKAMNSPGLTLGTANRAGTVRVASYGFSNPGLKQPVEPDMLFHIGSITKSFVALVILQLREEGKLDLHKPILDYLPWLPIVTTYSPVSVHDLLTHTSGLPNPDSPFPSDSSTRYAQAWKAGERFYYCNLGFSILGHLIAALDRRTWAASVKARILAPLGMKATAPVITNSIRPRTAESWVAYFEDRPYPRFGRLAPAANLQFDHAAGSIASTPADMTLYIHMLLNRGQAPHTRIVSPESFALMSKPWIKADEFGPNAYYGYGIAVETVDGHTILRHTGGMASFMSALYLDLDAGAGAFSSINAMQGYRPTPVSQYAVQLLAAAASSKSAPAAPTIDSPTAIKNAADYVGAYTSPDGPSIEITGDGALFASLDGRKIQLQRASGDSFQAVDPTLTAHSFVFGRAKSETVKDGGKGVTKPGPVVELMHGSGWYPNAKYTGPRTFTVLPEFAAFTGTYLAGGGFEGEQIDIVILKGQLWAEGDTALEPIGENEFRPTEDPPNPERLQFFYIANGKARLLKLSGADFFRFDSE
ncbi:MAG TPA: serine hydrolase domain-containing protein [Candidatus Angelobacter sp.]|nr:serine hydrolase domain-containing protein [Candidatus Angelobacter sp.]